MRELPRWETLDIVCKSFSDNEATSCSFVDFFKVEDFHERRLIGIGAGRGVYRFLGSPVRPQLRAIHAA
jgi:hypothetical protein